MKCLKNRFQKSWFSFVEIIIAIVLWTFLVAIWWTQFSQSSDKSKSAKSLANVETINTGMQYYLTEQETLPMPKGNLSYFDKNSDYSHWWDSPETYWVYGLITEGVLPSNRYLFVVPKDPWTGQFYAYGKTKNPINKKSIVLDKTLGLSFEVAGVVKKDNIVKSRVTWNHTHEWWPWNYIRSYNSPYFVSDDSTDFFPFNPDELVVTGTIWAYTWGVTINWNPVSEENNTLYEWGRLKTDSNSEATIYFSDGSRSLLQENSEFILVQADFQEDNNWITKIKLALTAWSIWTSATHLDEESEFGVSTPEAVAGVRWTIFWVKKFWNRTSVIVKIWDVDVKRDDDGSLIENLLVNRWESPKWIIIQGRDKSGEVTHPAVPDLLVNDSESTNDQSSRKNLLPWMDREEYFRTHEKDEETGFYVPIPDPNAPVYADCSNTNLDWYIINNFKHWESKEVFKHVARIPNDPNSNVTWKKIDIATCNDGVVTMKWEEILTCLSDRLHIEGDVCKYNDTGCRVANGYWLKSWNENTSSYGSCFVDSCEQNFHEENGSCVADTNISCLSGSHWENGVCVVNTRVCTINNWSGNETWVDANNAYGICVVSSCNSGFHEESGVCSSNTKVCGVSHWIGRQVWNSGAGNYESCNVVSCDGGYHEENGACASNTQVCSVGSLAWWEKLWRGGSYGKCVVSLSSISQPYSKVFDINTTNYKIKINWSDINLIGGAGYGNKIKIKRKSSSKLSVYSYDISDNVYDENISSINKIEIVEN